MKRLLVTIATVSLMSAAVPAQSAPQNLTLDPEMSWGLYYAEHFQQQQADHACNPALARAQYIYAQILRQHVYTAPFDSINGPETCPALPSHPADSVLLAPASPACVCSLDADSGKTR
jgi:hypothetical protein